ncbi:peptidase inhibitor family I36 protein [Streptosporangium sp. NPDC051023]|uniref:peptidase inhibitor family I36 protein n=1 Tax=Streptosporangium sp. NPDC051023 TaxID=3155410 RepID=UPI00344E4FB0
MKPMFKQRLRAASVVISVSAALVSATPAQAKVLAWAECYPGYVCLYGDINGEGRYRNEAGPTSANVGSQMNDLTSSIWNRTSYTVCFYEHINASGSELVRLGPDQRTSNVGSAANDKISSYTFC